MFEVLLAAVGSLGLLVAASSRRLHRSVVTAPMLALALGVLLGPVGIGAVEVPEAERVGVVRTGSELLLAVGLMAVALRYPLGDLRRRLRAVVILLVVVMPAMAVTVSIAASATLGVSLAVALGLGAALAPTDPVLASGVVTGDVAVGAVPARLREVLSAESGANDGLALPLVVAALAVADGGSYLAGLAGGLVEVAVGALAGAAIGAAAGSLLRSAERHHDVEQGPQLLFTLVLAFAVLGAVDLLHGNAILGVFVAGLAFSAVATGGERRVEASIDEGMNSFLVLPVFTLLGVVLPWEGWRELGWAGPAIVAAALLLRRLPWVLLLARPLRAGLREVLWLGWFGPVGVAALYYLGHLQEQGMVDPVVWDAGTLVVVASTVLHGATGPLGRRLVADTGRPGAGGEVERTPPGWAEGSGRL